MVYKTIKLKKAFLKTKNLLYIRINERKYKNLPYLFQQNNSDTLLIVFSAFTGEKRRYNYIKSFKTLKCDKLFILDPWGHLGSYNLFENGYDYPQKITQSLIDLIAHRKPYKHIYTAGSSKGGTCAIYFGLTIGADEIFSGACQYNLGTYLWREEFRDIFYGMMGKNAGQKEVDMLNDIVKAKVRAGSKGSSRIHVLYSKKEMTYERQIIDLLHDLSEFDVPFVDIESDFEKHEMVSEPFVKYVKSYIENQKQQ